MGRIKMEDKVESAVIKMCDRLPGSLRVVLDMLSSASDIDPDNNLGGMWYLFRLDDLEIYGSDIWLLYKDICGESLHRTMGVLRAQQLGIVTTNTIKHALGWAAGGRYTPEDVTVPCPLNVDDVMLKLHAKLPSFVSMES